MPADISRDKIEGKIKPNLSFLRRICLFLWGGLDVVDKLSIALRNSLQCRSYAIQALLCIVFEFEKVS